MADLDDTGLSYQRQRMVHSQLRSRGISDPRVLAAMETVPRHLFVPSDERCSAYQDAPLPIGQGQTISQPYMVARMTELLALADTAAATARVLEVGTGSGYQAAVLAEIANQVWSIERFPDLAERARRLLHHTRLSLSEIAATVGYSDQSHLTRDFRRAFNHSPGAYRWLACRSRCEATQSPKQSS